MSDGDATTNPASDPAPTRRRWLNRNVLGMGITSLLADIGYEMVTAVLPGFLAAIGAPPIALGLIEGLSDALASFVKLGAGWWSDRIGSRKAFVVLGYFLTGIVQILFAVAVAWPLVLVGRLVAWTGKGIRSPLRDAMLAESVTALDRGKAFGFHRAADTTGAILGPLLGAGMLYLLLPQSTEDGTAPYRFIFWIGLIPGLGAPLAFALLVREMRHAGNPALRLWSAIRDLPRGFRRFLVGVGVFGSGDFSHTLLVLAAAQILAPQYGAVTAASIAALLYGLRNATYAGAAYPVGALSDRFGRRGILVGGYVLGAITMAGFTALFWSGLDSVTALVVLFALAGTFIAVEKALEGAMTADLVPDTSVRGIAFGVTGTVNGVGDLISSVTVGALWAIDPTLGFSYAAIMMIAGAVLLHRVR